MDNMLITNWINKLSFLERNDALKMEVTPYRDWRIIVLFFFAGLVASVGFNIYMSIGINQDSFFSAAPKTADVVKFNSEGLAKVIAGIDEKAARFENAKTESVVVVDPSI